MTDNNHPITPTPKLLQQWQQEWLRVRPTRTHFIQWMLAKSAQWGYEQRGADNEAKLQKARDEELEACCKEMKSIPSPLGIPFGEMASNALRSARRPKPPSLAEKALEQLEGVESLIKRNYGGDCIDHHIRRALKRLQELEGQGDD